MKITNIIAKIIDQPIKKGQNTKGSCLATSSKVGPGGGGGGGGSDFIS
jgi:hypothetical protein